jgi:hypothetical protein
LRVRTINDATEANNALTKIGTSDYGK